MDNFNNLSSKVDLKFNGLQPLSNNPNTKIPKTKTSPYMEILSLYKLT